MNKKLTKALISLFIAAAVLVSLFGCAPTPESCKGHEDENCDGVCDLCYGKVDIEHSDSNEDLLCDKCQRCFSHTDGDCDGGCERCGATIKIEHSDTDDNSLCDKCGGCISHADTNCDGRCDECSATVAIEHTDRDDDGICDKCDGCISHRDSDCDGGCDECGATVAIEHTDRDGDGSCDKCLICRAEHEDGDCDGVCDKDGASVKIIHIDSDADGLCDKCDRCTEAHIDGGCDGICDRDGAAMEIVHKDGDGNGVCDKCDRCIGAHIDDGCDGVCDRDGASVPIVHRDNDGDGNCDGCGSCICDHKDTDADDYCDECGGFLRREGFKAEKLVDRSSGKTLYPTHTIGYNGQVYRGGRVVYTIVVTNTGNIATTVEVEDTVKAGLRLVSGGDIVKGDKIQWTVKLDAGETKSLSYTLEVVYGADRVGEIIDGGGASAGGKMLECEDLYIGRSFNEIDEKYINQAIRILAKSSWEGIDFLTHAYTIAFTQASGVKQYFDGTASEILQGILAGDEGLIGAVAPGLYGGKDAVKIDGIAGEVGSEITADDLVSGDIILVGKSDTKIYVVAGGDIFDVTGRASLQNASDLLLGLKDADGYAVVRLSYTLNAFTPSDPDEMPEAMNDYQKAIIATAESYLLRGQSLQYEDVWFGLISQTGEHRWAVGVKAPEEYTYDEWGYINCAVFTYDVYLQALGYALPNNMYTTANLSSKSEAAGMKVFNFINDRPGEYTDAEKLEVQRSFMDTLEVGDIVVVRRENGTGHAMLYVGNGRLMHSGGASYTAVNGVGTEIDEPTIRNHKVLDYIFNEASVSGNPFRTSDKYGDNYVTELFVVRPLNKFSGEIPSNTAARVENMAGIRADKLSSLPSSRTANPGDLITFTFSLYNVGDVAKTVEIYDRIPAGTVYVSGGDSATGGEMLWRVTVEPGETKTVSYTVRVADVADGTVIDGKDATVGGVSHRCAAIEVRRTLDENEAAAILAAIESIRGEGTDLTGLALVNEIYKRALGIDAIFTDTNADSVMRDGDESVFAQSTKKHNNKYLSELQSDETYYSGMLVDHLYGGMRFYSGGVPNDRTRLVREHNLNVGDVLIARSSSAANIYIYIGDGSLMLLNSGIPTATTSLSTVAERILYYGRDFAVLRPSFVVD